MSDLPPYVRDADQSPPPPPEAVQGQAGRPAVSPPQESALPLSGGGTPPAVVNFPPPVDDSAAGGDRAVSVAPAPAAAPAEQAVPTKTAGGYVEDTYYPNIGAWNTAMDARAAANEDKTLRVPPRQETSGYAQVQGDAGPVTPADRATLTPPKEAIPVTPGPGGTAVTTSPEPAKTAAAPPKQQPAQEQPLAATSGGAVQTGPPPSAAQYKGEIPIHSYNILGNQHPELFNLIKSTAESVGVDPRQLMHTAGVETGFSFNNQKVGKDGETSIFQILPSTQKALEDKYFGGQHYDLTKDENLPVAAKLAALYTRELDSKFGAGSYASVAAYNGGPGFMESRGRENAMRYAARYFDPNNKNEDYSKLDFGSGVGGTATANGFVRAAKISPDAAMKYVADAAPSGQSMSDAWQHVQDLMVQNFLAKGDTDGAEKAQDFVMRQAFMGSNMHLMGAMASLQRGDGTTAAQQLAKAHAFFPDGTAGRFMTNGTEVFGVRLDEATGKPLGQPFKITAQDINSQLKVTGNPVTFAKFLTDQQKAAAEIRLHNAQAGYQEVRPAIEGMKEAGRSERAAATINQAERNQLYANMRKQAELDAKYSELKGAKDAETAKQVDQWANSDPMQSGWPIPPEYKTPEDQQAYVARRDALARGLKTTAPNMSIADSQIKLIADGVIKGTYGIVPTMNPKDPSQNGYVVVDPKTKQPVPGSYYINTHAGEAFTNTQHPARALMQQQYQQSQQAPTQQRPAQQGAALGTGGAHPLAPYTIGNAVPGGASSITGVAPAMTQAVQNMVKDMPPEVERRFRIISGYRDTARQMQVNPSAPNSRHGAGTGPPGSGIAMDLKEDPVVLDWVTKNGRRYGLGFPLAHDPKERNHMELINPQTGARLAMH